MGGVEPPVDVQVRAGEPRRDTTFARALAVHWRSVVLAVLVVAAFVFCYIDVFAILVRQWWTNDVYSYGFLVPAISLYLLWIRRGRLGQVGYVPSRVAGGLILMVGSSILVAGRAVGIAGLQEVSIVATIAGLVLFLFGRRTLRVIWFPIAYLLLMMPIWDVVTERLHFPFQQFAAMLGTKFLLAVGVPVHCEGVLIELPNVTLEVARVCSGVNYLIAVGAVGIPLAYMSFRDLGRRVAVVLFAIVIAILGNPIRVALIGFLAYRGLSTNFHGPWHVLQGLSIAVLGYAALFVGVWVLSRGALGKGGATSNAPLPVGPKSSSLARPVHPPPATWSVLSVTILLAVGGMLRLGVPPRPAALARLGAVPLQVGEWRGRDIPASVGPGQLVPVLSGDLWRVYESPAGSVAYLYVGPYARPAARGPGMQYWEDQVARGGQRFDSHRHLAGGVAINEMRVRSGSREIHVLYLYSAGGRLFDYHIAAKLYVAWGAITRSGDGPLVIAVSWVGPSLVDRSASEEPVATFAGEIVPLLRGYLGR